jgi:hypothetical protein
MPPSSISTLVQFAQVAGHQLGQRGLGLAHEPARIADLLTDFVADDLFADRLGGTGVPAGGHAGQRPLHHHLGRQVLGSKVV